MKRLIVLLLAALLLLSGCSEANPNATTGGGLSDDSETTSLEPIAQKQVGTFGLSYYPEYGLNPYDCYATTNRAMFSLLYECLFVVSNGFAPEPVLCKSFSVSTDGLTYTFTLQPNVLFSDGSAMTADDVVNSINVARGSNLFRSRLAHVISCSGADGVVTILLDTPYENLPLMLDVPIVKQGTAKSERPIGTGPYKLYGSKLVYNTSWWQDTKRIMEYKEINLSAASGTDDVRDQFEFGGTDLVYCDPNAAASAGYRCDYEAWEVPTTVMDFIGFNLKEGWFTNAELRKAVTYALDRTTYCNEIYGGFAKATSIPCSPASPMYDETLDEQYDYAPEKFREAVQSSGVTTATEFAEYTGSILVNSEDPARVEVAQRIADVLNEAGVRVEVHKYSRSNFSYMVQQGDYDMYLGQVRLTANFDLTAFFSQYGYMNPGEMTTDDALLSMCTQALANSGNFSALCAQVVQRAQICPIAFRSYAIYVSRGMISAIEPGVDYVFRDPANVRLLADADETKLPEPTEPTDVSDTSDGDGEPDGTDATDHGQSADDYYDPNANG